MIGHCPGELVQLSEGRIVLLHTNRYPYPEGNLRARVSSDEGATWSDEYYVVSDGAGYSGSIVLDDDTIITVTGNTPAAAHRRPGRTLGHAYRQVAAAGLIPKLSAVVGAGLQPALPATLASNA